MSVVSSFQMPSCALAARYSGLRESHLVVVGGADKMTRVLRFGDGNVLSTLEGHITAVSAVAMDPKQERVAAGSDGGSIRVWDLRSGEGIRVFGNGHKSAITSVDYHHLGEFIATASRDTNLRIWDVRKKTSLQSYKGTPAELRVCRFSPSGRWVVSGCAEGKLRLYDLSAGRELQRFEVHTAPITSIAFHPQQFLMAASSEDGTVSLWDLEKMQLVYQSTAGGMRTPYSAVGFADGAMVAANEKLLRIYDFKGMGDRTALNVETSWSALQDLAVLPTDEAALGVECRGTSIAMSRIPMATKKVAGAVVRVPRTQSSGPAADRSGAAQGYVPQRVVRQPLPQPQQRATSEATRGFSRPAGDGSLPRANSDGRLRGAIPMLPQATPSGSGGVTDGDVADQLEESGAALAAILKRRATNVKIARQLPDMNAQLQHIERSLQVSSDGGTAVDMLALLQAQSTKERVTLDHVPAVLKLCVHALTTLKTEQAVLLAMKTTRTMNNKFRSVIDESLRAGRVATGVDLSMEARVEKARRAQRAFDDAFASAGQFVSRPDGLGDEARKLLAELPRPPQ